MEVGQFTYFQQVGGIPVTLPSFEMTYGLERLAMYVQDRENVFDLDFNGAPGDQRVTYGDVFLRAEREYSAHNFDYADTAMLTRHFADAEAECAALLRPSGSRCRPTTSASRRATCSTCWTRAG